MTALLTVTGTLVVRERIDLPAGAVATVKVVDAEGEVHGAAAFDVEMTPVDWAVTIDPQLVADPDRLLVWAMLRTGVGVWGTPELAPVSAAGNATETVLERVDGD
ncbi:YbaY family lipoprotein [Aeromicrobium sp. Leaf350]|uniref:YbaY family lipoprotein n=1 Tax=Aeromicrobium sp. Leaf350 TaxID=2876565 RepID=UPI001E3FF5A1|nr:YbaY family lipoprotein [Aeromicrobium sp. Leaf350]